MSDRHPLLSHYVHCSIVTLCFRIIRCHSPVCTCYAAFGQKSLHGYLAFMPMQPLKSSERRLMALAILLRWSCLCLRHANSLHALSLMKEQQWRLLCCATWQPHEAILLLPTAHCPVCLPQVGSAWTSIPGTSANMQGQLASIHVVISWGIWGCRQARNDILGKGRGGI